MGVVDGNLGAIGFNRVIGLKAIHWNLTILRVLLILHWNILLAVGLATLFNSGWLLIVFVLLSIGDHVDSSCLLNAFQLGGHPSRIELADELHKLPDCSIEVERIHIPVKVVPH